MRTTSETCLKRTISAIIQTTASEKKTPFGTPNGKATAPAGYQPDVCIAEKNLLGKYPAQKKDASGVGVKMVKDKNAPKSADSVNTKPVKITGFKAGRAGPKAPAKAGALTTKTKATVAGEILKPTKPGAAKQHRSLIHQTFSDEQELL